MALLQSPYERTIFLDADTTVCADMKRTFDFLDDYHLAMVPEPLSISDMDALANKRREVAPSRYFEMNSGVVLYRNAPAVTAFFEELQRRQTSGDQCVPPPPPGTSPT